MTASLIRVHVRIQTGALNDTVEAKRLGQNHNVGAIVTFMGLCRQDENLYALELEHYPGMAEEQMQSIAYQAAQKWPLLGIHIVHRVGFIPVGDPIVVIVVASTHRTDAFQAAEFIMDFLKTSVPIWKKEHFKDSELKTWVNTQEKDVAALKRWKKYN